MRLFLFLMLVLSGCGPLFAASVATLDGGIHHGAITVADARSLQVGDQALALRDCDWLLFSPAGDVTRSPELPCVVLADGGWLPAQGLTPTGQDGVRVLTPYGAVELALGEFTAWGSSTWLASLPADDQRDQLLVGEDQFFGAIIGIEDGAVIIDVEGLGENRVPWERVDGMRVAVPAPEAPAVSVAAPLVSGQPAVRLIAGVLPSLAVAPEQRFERWPRGRLRVLSDRRVWLADLKPALVKEEGAFGITWPYTRNKNMDGGSISLNGQTYYHGLVLHSQARLEWDLGGDFERLNAVVGIDDLVGSEGDCAVRIDVDGVVRWQQASIRGDQSALALNLDLAGAQRLVIVVEYGARYDIADHLALADAWLVRK